MVRQISGMIRLLVCVYVITCTISPVVYSKEMFLVGAPHYLVFEHWPVEPTKPNVSCFTGFIQHSHPLYERYHLLIIEQIDSNDNLDVNQIATCLGPGWIKVVLEQSPNALLIPTNEILIRFKSDTSLDDIELLLQENGLTVETEESSQFPRVVAKTKRPIAESQKIVNRLLLSPLVEKAEVNKLLIRFKLQ